MNIITSIKKQIPNCITLGNLACGVLASLFAVRYEISAYDTFSEDSSATPYLAIAAGFILLGIFLDFFDGMFARILKVASPIGKELDSLADVVTSGVAPGLILFEILSTSETMTWTKYLALLTPALAAFRLAKFNLDTRQGHSFRGLPAPANAIIWVGLAAIFQFAPVEQAGWLFSDGGLLGIALVSILTAILMIGELPMFSLKFNFKDLSWRTNKTAYIFLAGCAALIIALTYYSISLIILWYIILSIFTQKQTAQNE